MTYLWNFDIIFFMKKRILFSIFSVFCFLFFSCGESGYSLVLWNNPEAGISEGDIVKVFVKSNISHTYIIAIPSSKNKIEIPLWQISEPKKKSDIIKLSEFYSEYEHTYASVKLDGLPVRSEPVNTAKQVYRLRKNEIIRVLYEGEGQIPTNGKGNLPGKWLKVLMEGGTSGWCFSYNLELFERQGNNLLVSGTKQEEVFEEDEVLSAILLENWVPEYFGDMIKTGRYNLSLFSPDYGFSFGTFPVLEQKESNEDFSIPEEENGSFEKPDFKKSLAGKGFMEILNSMETKVLSLKTPDFNKSWKYSGIKKAADGSYTFDSNSVTVFPRGRKNITVQFTDSDGKTKSENFIAVSENIALLAEDEIERRQEELVGIARHGPVFHSSNYGTIIFNSENSVTWKNYQLLVPALVSKSALGSVTVSVEYYLSNQLKGDYDGILTFHFIGMEKPVNFLYKMDAGGLRLEDAAKAEIKGNLVLSRGTSPLVMYFSKMSSN